MYKNVFSRLGLPKKPLILAPLAGVSDHPFRRMCSSNGADLTYVEMISATALLHDSPRTIDMLTRHRDESVLGVQVTARTADEMGAAVARLNDFPFETLDINMGCPVKKVVKSGCGSAILKDPKRVYDTTRAAVAHTDRPVSVKIRLGWDHDHLNYQEVAAAAAQGGASWLTVHGRTRNDNYAAPVDLAAIREIKKQLDIPVIGNGNIFSPEDVRVMEQASDVDGFMVSRGALGNPWLFDFIKGQRHRLTISEWIDGVLMHLDWQHEAYGARQGLSGLICMRKHLLWYAKGWSGAKALRDQVSQESSWSVVRNHLEAFSKMVSSSENCDRIEASQDSSLSSRFVWDPKFEMDRQLDRGVGDEGMQA